MIASKKTFQGETIAHPAQWWHDHVYGILSTQCHKEREAEALTYRLLTFYIGFTRKDYLLDRLLEVSRVQYKALLKGAQQVAEGSPIQYVLGQVEFLDCTLKVNESVLIPRPETEEMVDHFLKHPTFWQQKPHPQLLDVGTGSGCIAIALAKAKPKAKVTALDVSPSALALAQENANHNGVAIDFLHLDFLKESLPAKSWDAILSNPPYIPYGQKDEVEAHVRAHEPHKALFVPSGRPLLFYEKISTLMATHLHDKGLLCTEVHQDFASKVRDLFQQKGASSVELYRDLQGKPRWVVAHK